MELSLKSEAKKACLHVLKRKKKIVPAIMEEVHEDSNFLVACRAKCLGNLFVRRKS